MQLLEQAGRNQRGQASLLCPGKKKGRAREARPLNGVKAGRAEIDAVERRDPLSA